VADSMTFTLPMMIARFTIDAVATLAAGWVTAALTRSTLARWLPGVLPDASEASVMFLRTARREGVSAVMCIPGPNKSDP